MIPAATFPMMWRATAKAAPPAKPSTAHDPARIETAIRELARAAAQLGYRSPLSRNPLPQLPDYERATYLVTLPVPSALMFAEADLWAMLERVAGRDHATAARARISAQLYEEFDQKAVEAAGPPQ